MSSAAVPCAGEVAQHLAQLVLLEGELLAHLHRRGAVAQPRDERARVGSRAVPPVEQRARAQREPAARRSRRWRGRRRGAHASVPPPGRASVAA